MPQGAAKKTTNGDNEASRNNSRRRGGITGAQELWEPGRRPLHGRERRERLRPLPSSGPPSCQRPHGLNPAGPGKLGSLQEWAQGQGTQSVRAAGGKERRLGQAAWVELGDLGPIRVSVSPTENGADADPYLLGSTGGRRGGGEKCQEPQGLLSLLCPQGGTSFLPSPFCLGKVPKCLWGRKLSGPHRKRPGPAGRRSIIG